jgi:hypothetical protein
MDSCSATSHMAASAMDVGSTLENFGDIIFDRFGDKMSPGNALLTQTY